MGTIGFAGRAAPAAVPDEPVTEQGPELAWDEGHEIELDFFGLLLPGELEALGEAGDVGIDDDALVEVKGIAEDHVGGFAADPIELHQGFHGGRHLAMVVGEESTTAALDMACFATEETEGADLLLESFDGGMGVIGGGAVFLEEVGGDEVDLFVR
jgi:hypothetical protein